MNPPPDRGGRSRYGGGSAQGRQHQQAAFPFLVDPTEGPAGSSAAAVRAFFPAPEGVGEPSSSSAERQQRYGAGRGAEISLGHGMHRYNQFGVEGNRDGGTLDSLPRHSSSPPGFFSSPVVDNGFSTARVGVGGGSDIIQQAPSSYNKKMKTPVNLPRQVALTQISEEGLPNLTQNMHATGLSEENNTASNVVRSFSGGFSIGSWEDSNSIAFSSPPSKAGIHNNDDIIATLSNYELQFGATKEATGVDSRYLQMQHDQVPFRARAKRGCATHPRSIAERERRTRISEKLRKLQALVPNMDKVDNQYYILLSMSSKRKREGTLMRWNLANKYSGHAGLGS